MNHIHKRKVNILWQADNEFNDTHESIEWRSIRINRSQLKKLSVIEWCEENYYEPKQTFCKLQMDYFFFFYFFLQQFVFLFQSDSH